MLSQLVRLSLSIAVGLALCGSAVGQTLTDASDIVAASLRAERLLQKEQWTDAEKLYDSLSRVAPQSLDPSLFLFGQAKAQYYAGHNREALRSFDDLLTRFPSSPYSSYATYFSANCQFKLGSLRDAIRRYLGAYVNSADTTLLELVKSSLSSFDPNLVQAVVSASDKPKLTFSQQSNLATEMAATLDRRKQLERANLYRSWRDNLVQESSKPALRTVASARLLRLAIVVPLSGELQAFGEDLYNGAVIGAAMAQEENGVTVQLTPYDTKGDPIAAARIAKDMSPQSFDAIVGPLTSDEASVTSAALGCGEFPMVIPAATEAGLTLLSPGSFQLSPNVELQGALMAEYAIRTLMADSAAVITPISVEATAMTRAFVDRFKALGGVVVATEQYRDRDRDFGAYIRDIKNVILGRIPDSAVFLDDRGDTLETEAVPAHVDCLYLPGSPDRVRQLLTQLRFYNLSSVYLGSDSWGDESIYNLSADVTRNALFPSAFVLSTQGQAYLSFASKYSTKYGRKPQRVAALGYDAVRVLASALVQSIGSREKIAVTLKRISGFDGASGRVTFGGNRENIELPLYRIAAGRPVPVEVAPAILESIRTAR